MRAKDIISLWQTIVWLRVEWFDGSYEDLRRGGLAARKMPMGNHGEDEGEVTKA